MRTPKTVPLGAALESTDEELDRLAADVEGLVLAARIGWELDCPSGVEQLLDAEPIAEP